MPHGSQSPCEHVSSAPSALSGIDRSAVRFDEGTTFSLPETYDYVRFPAAQEENDPSALTVLFDKQGNLAHTIETKIARVSETSVRFQIWKDGDPAFDMVLDEHGPHLTDGADWGKPSAQPITAQGFSWTKFNDCLAAQGIRWTVVVFVGIACAVACGATFGTACAICIAAEGGTSIATVYRCASQAIS
ncbi:hypothetical protein [Saccharopolyspora gloriosae]|uniref:hypothetical protein n=1 Tax=Saccharopolyspora gloriosae TaxID=455344 RepID=UPI001FB807D8|nr:hypothetical protein [Saccharopolyspora gloriosae]